VIVVVVVAAGVISPSSVPVPFDDMSSLLWYFRGVCYCYYLRLVTVIMFIVSSYRSTK
jgi:hypothetical protein